jgi:hypothetical protein
MFVEYFQNIIERLEVLFQSDTSPQWDVIPSKIQIHIQSYDNEAI